jgi:AcrR family transcriptional regulator
MAQRPARKRAAVARAGRRRGGTDAGGRDRLLDIAIALFAERGIANTTVAEIAKAAEVTSAMVHYWFDTRDKLLDAVVEERLAPIVSGVWEGVEASTDATDAVRGILTRMLDVTERSPWVPPLWLREIVQEGGLLRERILGHLPRASIEAFGRIVARGRERGEIGADISPDLLFISMLALVMLPQATARIWLRVNPRAIVDRAHLERHVMGLVMHGLAGAPRARAARGRSAR